MSRLYLDTNIFDHVDKGLIADAEVLFWDKLRWTRDSDDVYLEGETSPWLQALFELATGREVFRGTLPCVF
jgi:hypothetical protein